MRLLSLSIAAFCITISLVASSGALAGTPPAVAPTLELTAEEFARLSAYTPRPEYSRPARVRRAEGVGVFRLHVQRRTGAVEAVTVEQSTTHGALDASAVGALRRWRLRPDVLRTLVDPRERSPVVIIKIPVRFTMD
jgi:TonB family protein